MPSSKRAWASRVALSSARAGPAAAVRATAARSSGAIRWAGRMGRGPWPAGGRPEGGGVLTRLGRGGQDGSRSLTLAVPSAGGAQWKVGRNSPRSVPAEGFGRGFAVGRVAGSIAGSVGAAVAVSRAVGVAVSVGIGVGVGVAAVGGAVGVGVA